MRGTRTANAAGTSTLRTDSSHVDAGARHLAFARSPPRAASFASLNEAGAGQRRCGEIAGLGVDPIGPRRFRARFEDTAKRRAAGFQWAVQFCGKKTKDCGPWGVLTDN